MTEVASRHSLISRPKAVPSANETQQVLPPDQPQSDGALSTASVLATEEAPVAANSSVEKSLSFIRRYQQQVRYPELFAPSLRPLFFRQRQVRDVGSGLIVNALHHDDLSAEQMRALGQFRMQQFLLLGWYDPAYALTWGITSDPALTKTPPDTIHVLVGTDEGMLLSYLCMEPARNLHDDAHFSTSCVNHLPSDLKDMNCPDKQWGRAFSRWRLPWQRNRLSDTQRPVFLTECEVFGFEVFTSLRGLARIPVEQVREMSILLRNQVISGASASRRGMNAVVEAISAMAYLTLADRRRIRAILGHIDREASRLLSDLDIPVLYAPNAPAIHSSFGHDGPKNGLWSRSVDAPGRFWPFVISADDLYTHANYFRWLEQRLQGTPQSIVSDLRKLRRSARQRLPEAFVSAQNAEPRHAKIQWTSQIE